MREMSQQLPGVRHGDRETVGRHCLRAPTQAQMHSPYNSVRKVLILKSPRAPLKVMQSWVLEHPKVGYGGCSAHNKLTAALCPASLLYPLVTAAADAKLWVGQPSTDVRSNTVLPGHDRR